MNEEKGPLEGLVKNLIKDIGHKDRPSEEEMAEAWGLVVGKAASRHTRPVSIKKASLVVNVDRSSWLYELTLKKKEILKSLGEKLGSKKIKDIRFRIGETGKSDEKDKRERPRKEA